MGAGGFQREREGVGERAKNGGHGVYGEARCTRIALPQKTNKQQHHHRVDAPGQSCRHAGSAEILGTVSRASNCTSQHVARTGTTTELTRWNGADCNDVRDSIKDASQPETATPNARTTVPVCLAQIFPSGRSTHTRVASALWEDNRFLRSDEKGGHAGCTIVVVWAAWAKTSRETVVHGRCGLMRGTSANPRCWLSKAAV